MKNRTNQILLCEQCNNNFESKTKRHCKDGQYRCKLCIKRNNYKRFRRRPNVS